MREPFNLLTIPFEPCLPTLATVCATPYQLYLRPIDVMRDSCQPYAHTLPAIRSTCTILDRCPISCATAGTSSSNLPNFCAYPSIFVLDPPRSCVTATLRLFCAYPASFIPERLHPYLRTFQLSAHTVQRSSSIAVSKHQAFTVTNLEITFCYHHHPVHRIRKSYPALMRIDNPIHRLPFDGRA